MLAATNLAPVIGVDIHFVKPPPHPMPHPFTGLVLDPIDFIPIIGGTVLVSGIPRAQAGSTGFALPEHKPIGGAFVKQPDNDCTVFMGSATVIADGEPFSYMALPVLSCQQVGIPAPKRKKPHKPEACFLPTSIVLPIPFGAPVLVGGPPTIAMDVMVSTLAMTAIGRGLKKLAKLKVVEEAKDGLRARAKKMLGCEGLGLIGHPVDVVTGANVDTFDDAEVGGPLSIAWRRRYSSLDCAEDGPMGRGFRHEYQRELLRLRDGAFAFVDADGAGLAFPPLPSERLEAGASGYVLCALGGDRFEVRCGEERMEFAFAPGCERAPMQRLTMGEETLELDHDEAGNLIAIWQADGTRLCLLRDEAGHVVRTVVRRPDAPGEDETLGSYAYDAAGRLVEWRDAAGNAGRYDYDEGHRLVRCTDRRGYAFFFRYDAEGRCVESSGEDGLFHVRLEYAPHEQRTIVTQGDGGRWEYAYDANGTLTRIVDPYGGARIFRQDGAGRIVEDVDPNGNVVKLLYDQDGRHYARVDPLGSTLPTYDEDPRPPNPLAYDLPETPLAWEHGALVDLETIGPLDEESTALALVPGPLREVVIGCDADFAEDEIEIWALDANHNIIDYRDRDGHTRSFTYASWNLLRQDIQGCATAYGYSSSAQVAEVVGPSGNRIELLHDHKDRVAEVKVCGRAFERYRYDAADNLIEKRDAEGRPILAFVPGVGRAVAVRRLHSGETQRFEYDREGRIAAASTEHLRCTFEHDAAGRMIRDERDGAGVRHVFEGDALRETIYFERFVVRYRREGGRLTITDPAGSRHTVEIDEAGLIARTLSSGAVEILRYDAEGRCLLKIWKSAQRDEDAWVRRFRYSRERDLLAVEDSRAGTTEYAYDATHRLRRRVCPNTEGDAFEYDDAGNLVAQPGLSGAIIGDGDLISAADGHRFTYDHRHRIALWHGPSGVRVFEHDSLDRLTRALIGGKPWSAAYDPLCRRIEKTWRGEITRYFWDDLRLAAEVRADGSLRLYVYEDRTALVPFMLLEYASIDAAPASGTAYFLATDHLGAPVRAEDAAGRTAWAGSIEPFGGLRAEQGAIELSLRFPGHWHDAETGLHLNGFRYYSPVLGRYLEPDPLGPAGGINLHAYLADGNPLRDVDIDGLTKDCQPTHDYNLRSRGNLNFYNLRSGRKPPKFRFKDPPRRLPLKERMKLVEAVQRDTSLETRVTTRAEAKRKQLVNASEKRVAKAGKVYDPKIGEGYAVLKKDGKTFYLAAEPSVPDLEDRYGAPVVSLNKSKTVLQRSQFTLEDRDFVVGERAIEREAQKYVDIARHIDGLKSDQIIIHCNQGRTRTPIIAAAYLLYKDPKLPTDEAIRQVKEAIRIGRGNIPGVLGEHGNKMVNVLERARQLMHP
jgi:RHS repeat-associated protein